MNKPKKPDLKTVSARVPISDLEVVLSKWDRVSDFIRAALEFEAQKIKKLSRPKV